MTIAFFGSSIVSAYWNGAATYYRGMLHALAKRGHQITFYEPDAYDRQQNRDIPDPSWCRVVVYENNRSAAEQAIESSKGSDLLVKASGVGVFDELLEEAVLGLQSSRTMVVFWDVDAPATLDRVERDPGDPFRACIPRYDAILTYGGGNPVIDAYRALGAKECVPIYNALDPATHHPVPPERTYEADLGFLGNRLPDRERRVEEFFLDPAASMPGKQFLLGGSGWQDKPMSPNVNYIGHVSTNSHNAFNCSPLALLNISRESMARYGFSPATRVFEAAGAGACLITDHWEGIDFFFEPGDEILVARHGEEVIQHLQELVPQRARQIGRAGLRRVLADHTYARRALDFERALDAGSRAIAL
jgi:spore maturation protein CgeB